MKFLGMSVIVAVSVSGLSGFIVDNPVMVSGGVMDSVSVDKVMSARSSRAQSSNKTKNKRVPKRNAKGRSKPLVVKGVKSGSKAAYSASQSVYYASVGKVSNKPYTREPVYHYLTGKNNVVLSVNGDKVYNEGVEIKTCEELIGVWKPVFLSDKNNKNQDFPVRCATVDEVRAAYNGRDGILGYSVLYMAGTNREDTRLVGADEIVISKGQTVLSIVETFIHESWHVRQSYWSSEKQKEYLNLIGKSSFYDANDYMDDPLERWAWAAASCRKGVNDNSYAYLLPNGCKTVNKFGYGEW